MQFYCPRKQRLIRAPSIISWTKTVKSFISLSEKLFALGITFFTPRNLNQDAIETFFDCIKGLGARYINPNCVTLTDCDKTLLVYNFMML